MTTPTGPDDTTAGPAARAPRRRTWLVAVGAGTAVAAVIGGLLLLRPGAGVEIDPTGTPGLEPGADEQWSVTLSTNGLTEAVAFDGLTVLQTFDDPTEPEIVADNLVAVDDDGDEAWTVEDAGLVPGGHDADGMVVDRGSGDFNDPSVGRIDLEGEEVWNVTGVEPVAVLGEVVAVEPEPVPSEGPDQEPGGVTLLDRRTGEVVAELPGRYAAHDDTRVVVVDGGDVAAYDATADGEGAEQWRTTVDDGYGQVPETRDLDELTKILEDLDPDSAEGRRQLRELRQENREYRDFERPDRAYFGADRATTISAATGEDLVWIGTANPDPLAYDFGDDSAGPDPTVLASYVVLDPVDGAITVERSRLGERFWSADDMPLVSPGVGGAGVVVDGELLAGPDAEPVGEVPGSAEALSDPPVYLDPEGLVLGPGLEEVADLDGDVAAWCDDGVYVRDGGALVLRSYEGAELARVDTRPGSYGVRAVDAGVVVQSDTEELGDERFTLYR